MGTLQLCRAGARDQPPRPHGPWRLACDPSRPACVGRPPCRASPRAPPGLGRPEGHRGRVPRPRVSSPGRVPPRPGHVPPPRGPAVRATSSRCLACSSRSEDTWDRTRVAACRSSVPWTRSVRESSCVRTISGSPVASAGEITIRGGLVSLRGTLVGVSLDLVAVGRALIGVRGGLVPVGGGLIGGGGRLIGVLPSSIPTPADTRFLFSPSSNQSGAQKVILRS